MQEKNISSNNILQKTNDKISIIPIFMPLWACPQICIYCNQSLQTGMTKQSIVSKANLEKMLSQAKQKALENKKNNIKSELAFYGGTFSALPDEEFYLALNFLKELKEEALIVKARCSTRPDACQEERLKAMKAHGIDTIELGIQSYSNEALAFSHRAYTKEIAINACEDVKKHGFSLGIQLMPNLPLQEYDDFLEDFEISLALQPEFMRLYPCLVVEGTKLATLYKQGLHKVWDFDKTLELLAKALYLSWQANIPIIRIGVAYEEDFYAKVIAGVHHQALGQMVQQKALEIVFDKIIEEFAISNPSAHTYDFPLYCKGYFMFNKSAYFKEKNIRAKNINFHNSNEIYVSV